MNDEGGVGSVRRALPQQASPCRRRSWSGCLVWRGNTAPGSSWTALMKISCSAARPTTARRGPTSSMSSPSQRCPSQALVSLSKSVTQLADKAQCTSCACLDHAIDDTKKGCTECTWVVCWDFCKPGNEKCRAWVGAHGVARCAGVGADGLAVRVHSVS